jgi:hypothetical protein
MGNRMQIKSMLIVYIIILIGLCCSPVENINDSYVAVKPTISVKKYTIVDTTILDSSTVSLSEIPTAFCTLCRTDTSANAQYLDSVCFPSDFLNMEFNYFRNSINYLKRTYALQTYNDSIIFIGSNYISVSPCESIDTINRRMNNFLLYGTMKEVRQNNLIARSKNSTLFSWFNAPDVNKLISDRKNELANWNRIRDSMFTNTGMPYVIARPYNWPFGVRDTACYYYVDLRFSLEP